MPEMLEFVFARRRGVLLPAVVLALVGVFAVSELPTKLYPSMRKPAISVRLSHPTHTAVDFHDAYGDEIENTLSGIRGVDIVEATYRDGNTRIRVEFEWREDPDEAMSRVEGALSGLRTRLPEESRNYSVGTWRGENPGYLAVAVYSPDLDPIPLYEMIEPVLRGPLSRVEDAESVDIVSVEELRADLRFDHDALLRYGLAPHEVAQTVQGGYRPQSLGSFNSAGDQTNVRVKHGIDSIFEIHRIQVASVEGTPVLLEDVAEVSVRYDLPRRLFRANGERAVMIYADPIEGGNIKRMADEISAILEEKTSEFEVPVRYEHLVDPAAFIDNAVGNVLQAAALGATFAMLVIVVLLGEPRNIFIIGLSIPLTMTYSFILMYAAGISINLISLGGMTLSVGMIIDSTIVVMENIHRRRKLDPRRGEETITLILTAVREVRSAVVVATMTSVAVFLPLTVTSPLTAAILGDLALAVVFALACSLFVALFVVPLIAYYLFHREKPEDLDRGLLGRLSTGVLGVLTRAYRFSLERLLASRFASLAFIGSSATLLVVLVLTVLPKIPAEIIADPESDKVVLWFRHNTVDDQEELLDEVIPLEKELMERYRDELANIFVQIRSSNAGSITLSLRSSREMRRVEDELRDTYASDDDWRFGVFPWDPAAMPLPRMVDLHLGIDGDDPLTAVSVLGEAADLVRETDLYGNVFTNPPSGFTEELILKPRRYVIDQFDGYSLAGLVSFGQTLLAGRQVIEMTEANQPVQVRIQYPEGTITSRAEFEGFLLPYNGGAIPMRHFFDLEREQSVGRIVSYDGERDYRLQARMRSDAPDAERYGKEAAVVEMLERELELPPGYTLRVENPREMVDEAIDSLILALIASLVIIYLLLAVQFNSLRVPIVILLTVPLGFIGVIATLHIGSSTVSLNSMLGTILLGGIVVNNAILLIDFYFRQARSTTDRVEAILNAAVLRFPPIVITMATTILGMLPIALALGDGTNIIQPLGIAVSGGLAVSTVFTLYMVPCVLNFMKPPRVRDGYVQS